MASEKRGGKTLQGFMRPPQAGAPQASRQATGMHQSPLGGGSMGGSAGWQGGNAGGISQPSPGPAAPSQTASGGFGLGMSSPMDMASGLLAHAMSSSSLPPRSNSAVLPEDSRAMSTPTGSQNLANLTQHGSLQGTPTLSYGGSRPQQTLPVTKPSVPAPGVSARVSNSTSQWPKVNQSDIQKYTKVFGDVDKDKDGKITAAEACTLFLSWRLSRDVLKQLWDLSDHNNDGMLSLREFCIALYLMERHRAGTPLPPSLPDSLKFDETLLRATGLPSTPYTAPSWQQNQGLSNRAPGAPGLPTGGVRPPLPQPLHPQTDGATRQGQPRSYMSGMDNHAAPQGSKDDRSGVNSTAQEGSSWGGTADSTSMMVDHFTDMGFPAEKVRKALEHTGERQDEEAVLEWLVAHQETDLSTDIREFSSSSEGVDMADFDDKSLGEELTDKDRKFLFLVEMGFAEDEVSCAIDICGEHESVEVLADAIYAAQVDKRGGSSGGNFSDGELSADKSIGTSGGVKRKNVSAPLGDKRRPHNKQLGQVDRAFVSGPVVGFDLPIESTSISIAEGPPYFYFESLDSSRQRVREESRFLCGIQPEFVDSRHFSVAAKERSYVHNLPTAGRFHINPTQPRTIHGVFPQTRKWWPEWDTRTQLNSFRTMTAPATVFKKMRLLLTKCDDYQVYRKQILDECKDWNLIWVGPKSVAALDPREVEKVLGLPRDHTRGFKMRDRYWCLGNSVQVDTVAYHLSVLKAMFPSGIRVLSLFSGIGGAEVALDRLGIHLKVVVSTEFSQMNQNIMRTWWDQSKQTGELIQIDDVQQLKGDYLQTLVRRFGGFDLIIGGSPSIGGNRHNLAGKELEQSSVFRHYSLILEQVKVMTRM